MVESLNRWEKTIGLYRTASGVDISDGILPAAVLEHSPESFQNILKQAPSCVRASYSAMRGWLREFAETLRRYDGTSGSSSQQTRSTGPMDVDQTRAVSGFSSGKDGNWKSKGKGKSKDGKGNGKGKSNSKDSAGTARRKDTSVPTAGSASPTVSRRVVRQQPLPTMMETSQP